MERRIGHGYTLGKEKKGEKRSMYNKGGNIYNRTASVCSGKWSEGSMGRLNGRENQCG